jgi:hypothetical protein
MDDSLSYYKGRKREKVDILRHEAGHMVTAKVLGFDTGRLTFSPTEAGAEIILDLALPDIPALVSFIKRRAMVLYAGAMAEALNADGSDIDNDKALGLLKAIEASDDYSKVREITRILTSVTYRAGAFGDLLKDHNVTIWNRAAEIVEKMYGSHIVAISKACRMKLGGREELVIPKEEIEQIAEWSAIERGSERV